MESKRGNTMSAVEKLQLKKDLGEILKKNVTAEQQSILEKMGLYCSRMDAINLDFHGIDDGLLFELKRELEKPRLSGKTIDHSGKDGWRNDDADDDEKKEGGVSRALRAAMLKSRFADTIAQAKGASPVDQEKLRLKRKREEEKLEKAVELKRKREEEVEKAVELKRKREKEVEKANELKRQRKAARMALELVEKSVDVVDNFKVMRDFQSLIGCSNGVICGLDFQGGELINGDEWRWRQ